MIISFLLHSSLYNVQCCKKRKITIDQILTGKNLKTWLHFYRTYCCNKYNYFTCGAVLAVWWSAWSLSIPMIEFKSRSSLHIFLNVKYWVGLFKKLCPLLLRHCQDLFKISFTLDSKKFMSSKRRNTKSEDIFPLLHYYVYSQAMNIWIN